MYHKLLNQIFGKAEKVEPQQEEDRVEKILLDSAYGVEKWIEKEWYKDDYDEIYWIVSPSGSRIARNINEADSLYVQMQQLELLKIINNKLKENENE